MRPASVAGWTTLLAAVVSAIVLGLMLFRGLAEPETGAVLSLEPMGWAFLVSALACLSVSIILVVYAKFLRHTIHPTPENTSGAEPVDIVPRDSYAKEAPAARDISRLPDDERRLYDMIEAAGGEILQMKLVSSGEFSKSKVTRLLDKLEDRELIKRERHGMTNMVRLVRGPSGH